VRYSAVLIEDLLGILWGLTFGGYALVRWPLSFFNHRLVWDADAGQIPAPPEVRITSPAIRGLAVRIMAFCALGYAAWALFQTVLTAFASRASLIPWWTMMPWWVVTGLMGWSKWFVVGLLLWLSARVAAFGATRAAGSEEGPTTTYGELIGVAGFALLVLPILSFAATLVVIAIKGGATICGRRLIAGRL
jgi:hypothetical protein